MADPGDPLSPDARATRTDAATDDLFEDAVVAPFPHDDDDMVGFSSAASLIGRTREPPVDSTASARATWPPAYPQSTTTPLVEPDLDEPDLFEPVPRRVPPVRDTPAASFQSRYEEPAYAPATPDPNALPAWAMETAPMTAASPARTSTAPARPTFGRNTRGQTVVAEGAMGLYAVYALILFAVPTFGVAALIGLIAVFTRPLPEQPLALSRHLFQKRTLKAAAIAAVVGAVLIAAPLGVGVLILFLLAVWTIARGAWGVMTLKAGQTIARPSTWLISEAR